MILHPVDEGWVAVTQSAHALLSFQLADHWGNRSTPRPAPRADVLAAALVHDLGWDGREEPPRRAQDGTPLAFDTVSDHERRQIWSDSATRASIRGDYVGYLVSHHVSYLADQLSTGSHEQLLAAEAVRRRHLVARLASDARYRQCLRGRQDEINRAVVRLCDAIAVHLLLAGDGVRLRDLPQREGPSELALTSIGGSDLRLRPWPFAGRRLSVHAEGRRLRQRRFADDASLERAWRQAERVRLTWHLLAPGTPRRASGSVTDD